MASSTNDRRGFTLIELLITIAITAILIAVAIPSYRRFLFRARQAEASVVLSNMKTNQWGYFGVYDCFANTEQHPVGMVGAVPLPWTSMTVAFMNPCDGMVRTLKDLGVEPSITRSYYQYQCVAQISMAAGVTHEFTCSGQADIDGDTMNQEIMFCTDQARVGMGLNSPQSATACTFPYDVYIVSFGTY